MFSGWIYVFLGVFRMDLCVFFGPGTRYKLFPTCASLVASIFRILTFGFLYGFMRFYVFSTWIYAFLCVLGILTSFFRPVRVACGASEPSKKHVPGFLEVSQGRNRGYFLISPQIPPPPPPRPSPAAAPATAATTAEHPQPTPPPSPTWAGIK